MTSPSRPSRRPHAWLLGPLIVLASAALAVAPLAGAPASADPAPAWWRDATFYQIFVRSFADAAEGPLANDGIGDLQGLIDHLDYLNDGRGAAGSSLGVTALWLMPINPSPSYHGYDVTDYFSVNPQYGDLPLMRRLVSEAHRRGIRVIVDLVLNHASSEHPLFKRALADPGSEARQMFRFAPVPEQSAGPWGEPVWHPAGREYYYGVFTAEMPDWNFRDPAVTEHHRRAAAFWLRDVGVDGFRLDAVRYFLETDGQLQDTAETKAWLREFTAYCHSVKPSCFVIGECYADSDTVHDYLREQSTDSLFEFELAHATLDAVHRHAPGTLERQLARLGRLYGGAAPWACFLANHDQDRTLTQLGGNLAEARLAAELQFTEPGIPFVYYGEEIGMMGGKPDPDIRTPMQWTDEAPNAGFTAASARPWHSLGVNAAEANVARELADPDSLLSLYRRLIRINAASQALRRGLPLPLSVKNGEGVYAAARETESEMVLIIANLTENPVRGCSLSLDSSHARVGWRASILLGDGKVNPVWLSARGGFDRWKPIDVLAPQTEYLIRMRPRS